METNKVDHWESDKSLFLYLVIEVLKKLRAAGSINPSLKHNVFIL